MLTLEGCRTRQARFLAKLAEQRIDAALISHPRDIYYLTGLLADDRRTGHPSLLYLGPGKASWLVTWGEGEAAVDDLAHFPAALAGTMNPDNLARLTALAKERAARCQGLARLGFQEEALPHAVARAFQEGGSPGRWAPIDPLLTDLQLRKDPDEVECLRATVRATLAGYAAGAAAIHPGASELAVYLAASAAAQQAAGQPHYLGGDFRSGEAGGPARDRAAAGGEMYIIDAQADLGGYWTDMSRAWAVSGEPDDLQASVYEHLAAILRDVPRMVRIGDDTRGFWRQLDARIREHPHLADRGLVHHGGHGVGLRPHEGPDINRDRGGAFAVGNVFTCEPGAYSDALRQGIRLENIFLITESGVEVLTPFPLTPVLPR
jgi:Xaa-Pro aminopeptidase